MPSIFSRIIEGDLPGRFVWRDDVCVVFLSIAPLHRGHALVVPIDEVDHWIDLDAETAAHLMRVAHVIGRAQAAAFRSARVGLMIAGLEIPHTHLHVVPMDTMRDLDFAHANHSPRDDDLDSAAESLRESLRAMGRQEVTDS